MKQKSSKKHKYEWIKFSNRIFKEYQSEFPGFMERLEKNRERHKKSGIQKENIKK